MSWVFKIYLLILKGFRPFFELFLIDYAIFGLF
jgi:hypothetical protein